MVPQQSGGAIVSIPKRDILELRGSPVKPTSAYRKSTSTETPSRASKERIGFVLAAGVELPPADSDFAINVEAAAGARADSDGGWGTIYAGPSIFF